MIVETHHSGQKPSIKMKAHSFSHLISISNYNNLTNNMTCLVVHNVPICWVWTILTGGTLTETSLEQATTGTTKVQHGALNTDWTQSQPMQEDPQIFFFQ